MKKIQKLLYWILKKITLLFYLFLIIVMSCFNFSVVFGYDKFWIAFKVLCVLCVVYSIIIIYKRINVRKKIKIPEISQHEIDEFFKIMKQELK